jgi:hypothetical protein
MKEMRVIYLILLLIASAARAEVTLDAYYAIQVNGKHVGFSVQRDEYDPKTKTHKIKYFIKTNEQDNDMEQFVSTEQTDGYQPKSFRFLSRVRKAESAIRGNVRGKDLKLTFKEPKGQKTVSIPLSGDMFFSSALGPVLIASKLSKGKALSFHAINEEDGFLGDGVVYVIDETEVSKHKVYRLITHFQNVETEVWLLDTGVALASQSTHIQLRAEMVANRLDATEGLDFNLKTLAKYFGSVPEGKINPFARKEIVLPKKPLFTGKPSIKSLEAKGKIPIKIPVKISK